MWKLTSCRACGHRISRQALSCPQCGHPKEKEGSLIAALFIVLMIFMAACCFFSGGSTNHTPHPYDPTPTPASTPPAQRVVADGTTMHEGTSRVYNFTLDRLQEVSVTVMASPRPVNVLVFSARQWAAYQRATSAGGTGRYEYTASLSTFGTVVFVRTAALPPDTWTLLVQRPVDPEGRGMITSVTTGVELR
jgi:hypothetical protein